MGYFVVWQYRFYLGNKYVGKTCLGNSPNNVIGTKSSIKNEKEKKNKKSVRVV